jgi:hypothetical protein
MIDYWVSFATSLDPNDGKGSQRTHITGSFDLLTIADTFAVRSCMGRLYASE